MLLPGARVGRTAVGRRTAAAGSLLPSAGTRAPAWPLAILLAAGVITDLVVYGGG
jgi:hypothetical protein